MPTDLHANPQPGRWFDYDRPADPSSTHSPPLCSTAHAWASTPPPLTTEERQAWRARARELLARENAVLVAHYYVDAELQDLARETGGCVGDSLEMARFGRDHEASTIIVAGVRFMGETAFILSPEKRILMPDLDATCSLDLGCAADEFAALRSQHPGRTTVVYANTSAAVKAQADWVVTSSVGLDIVASLHARGEKILWAPDRHLGSYIQRQTGADMVLWQGSCLVHNEFKGFELDALRADYPYAQVLVHPESPDSVVAQADVVGSTSRLIQAAMELDATHFIVATDLGILHEMRLRAPGKTFLPAPTSGNSATCKSCAFCPWMAMNGLAGLVQALEHGTGRITLDLGLAHAARRPIARMLDFAANRNMRVQASGDMEKDTELYSHVGAA